MIHQNLLNEFYVNEFVYIGSLIKKNPVHISYNLSEQDSRRQFSLHVELLVRHRPSHEIVHENHTCQNGI